MFKKFLKIILLIISYNCLANLKVKVWPNKIAYQVGEDCLIKIHIRNDFNNERIIQLKTFVEYEIDKKELISVQDIILKGNEEKTLLVYWKPNMPVLGCEVKVDVIENGKNIASAKEYFNVVKEKKEIVRVGIAGQFRISGSLNETEKEYNRFFVEEGLRKGYVNIAEAHGLYACAFSRLTPTEEEIKRDFFPGGFPYGISGTLDQINQMKENGILTTIYAFFMPNSPVGLELARARPDLVMRFKRGQASFGQFDVKEIEDAKNYTKEHFKLISCGWMPDQLNKEVLNIHINALINARKFWGIDGVRWDGHISPRYYYILGNEYYDYKGNPVPPIEKVDYLTGQNLKYIKDSIRKIYPDFVFMANHMWQMGGSGAFVKNEHSEEYAALAEGGTGVCNEPLRHAYLHGNLFNKWSNMSRMLVFESDKANKYGGYAYAYPPTPEEVSPVTTKLIYSLLYATRNRPWFAIALYGPFLRGPKFVTKEAISYFNAVVPITRFATRFSGILFGYNIERCKDPEKFIIVESEKDIWWKEYVHIRKISDTERQVIVDLFNPPENEFVNQFADEKEFPVPVKDVKIIIKLSQDEKIISAFFLTPDIDEMRQRLTILEERFFNETSINVKKVIIPELKCWGIVVFNIKNYNNEK